MLVPAFRRAGPCGPWPVRAGTTQTGRMVIDRATPARLVRRSRSRSAVLVAVLLALTAVAPVAQASPVRPAAPLAARTAPVPSAVVAPAVARRRFLPRRRVGLDHDPRLDDHVPRPRRGPRCRDEPVRRPRPGEGRRVGDPDPRRVLPVRQARHDRPGAGRSRAAARPRAGDHREPARDPRPRRVMDRRRPGRDLPGRRRAACLAARGRPPGHGGGPGPELEVLAPDGTTPLFAGAFSTTVVVRPAEPGTRLQLDAQPTAHDTYRGALKVVLSGSSARVVNRVGLDDYLRGVLPAEMPSSWPGAALKAQAVASRSYAVRRLHPGYGRLRPLRRHPHAGLPRRRGRDRSDQRDHRRRPGSDPRQGPAQPRDQRLLPLDRRRRDREQRVRVRRAVGRGHGVARRLPAGIRRSRRRRQGVRCGRRRTRPGRPRR